MTIDKAPSRRSLLAGLAGTCLAAIPADARERVVSLLAAAGKGDSAAVGRLIGAGAALEARGTGGRTALLVTVAGNHVEAAKLLIDAGADINAVADNKDTPWLLAGADGRVALLRLMLASGRIDYTKRNRYGGNALIPAAHHGHIDAVRLLTTESKVDVDHVNDLGWTAVLEAVILGDGGPTYIEIVRLLIAAKANPNLADRDGVTPLGHARRRGFRAISDLLMAAGGR